MIAMELAIIVMTVQYGVQHSRELDSTAATPSIAAVANDSTGVLSVSTRKHQTTRNTNRTTQNTNKNDTPSAPGTMTTSLTSTNPPSVSGSSDQHSGTVITTAHITAYGYYDNTPAGYAISNPVIHKSAGGIGTYADPITIAVGHSIVNGKDILDYPAGTKIYIPYVKRYFIVEDTCGDGNLPQNGPCHTGFPAGLTTWVDMWAGGTASDSEQALLQCESKVTDGTGANAHTIILNPDANREVVSGPLFKAGSCTDLY